jgi:hypothetical protein
MRVLIGCECSGVVRRAFRERGHEAWSCDLLPAEDASPFHIQGDLLGILDQKWDLGIFHPPCTHLAVSGAAWFKRKGWELQRRALEFFIACLDAPIERVCVENPVGITHTRVRPPDCVIQPWQFGDEAQKTTCLWLRNLPPLVPTKIVGRGEIHVTKSGKRMAKWHSHAPTADADERRRIRAVTFKGVAEAMAQQWSNLPPVETDGFYSAQGRHMIRP